MRTDISSIRLVNAILIGNHILSIAERDNKDPVAICIVDAFGSQLYAVRMTQAPAPSVATAYAKARTALAYQRNTVTFHHAPSPSTADTTEQWERNPNGWSQLDVALAMGLDPSFCSWAGGVTIQSAGNDAIIGAVGVSGRDELDDHELALLYPSSFEMR